MKGFSLIRCRTDGGIFNIRRLQDKTKLHLQLVRDLLIADDCGVFAHNEDHLQKLMNHFSSAAKDFGLTISTQKTKVMYQPPPGQQGTALNIFVDDCKLKHTDAFTYLESVLSEDGH